MPSGSGKVLAAVNIQYLQAAQRADAFWQRGKGVAAMKVQ